MGGGNRGVGGGISVGIPMGQANVSREIVVEFVDDSKAGVFWLAKSESRFNSNATPESRQAKIEAIVEKILKSYPPKK
ncbi:DUF4136 domain-containing protein [Lacinutrix neustonica]|uniref:DUF4136 domain-containing protein n=1 Tax=Lacinutrix neustonica TaxID=2980107 RepID=A0A9E8MZ83_9FLAO|nr:DUF4136 domain-containing protein [Lacinutrix neustonica]WAC03609.1 DUF4136 domain-containing protein [Lacinutrix neustonica]